MWTNDLVKNLKLEERIELLDRIVVKTVRFTPSFLFLLVALS